MEFTCMVITTQSKDTGAVNTGSLSLHSCLIIHKSTLKESINHSPVNEHIQKYFVKARFLSFIIMTEHLTYMIYKKARLTVSDILAHGHAILSLAMWEDRLS